VKKLILIFAFAVFAAAALPCAGQAYMYFPKDPTQFSAQIQTDSAAAYSAAKTAGAVAGIVVGLPASTVDCGTASSGPSICSSAMTTFDNDLKTIVGNPGGSDQISIIFEAAQGGTGAGADNTFTPAYVFTTSWSGNALCSGCSATAPLDVAFCHNYQGSAANGWTQAAVGSNVYNINNFTNTLTWDNSGAPLVWEPPFLSWYQQTIAILLNWYHNTSIWKNQMGYMRWGAGTGGEAVIGCPNVMAGAYSVANGGTANQSSFPNPTSQELSETLWKTYQASLFSTVQTTEKSYGSTIKHAAGMYGGTTLGSGDGSTPLTWADDDAAAAIANGLGIGTESLQGNTQTGDQIAYAAASNCSADWCAMFNQYFNVAPMTYLQTITASSPTCLLQPSSCNQTGSLLTVLPFASERHTKVLEIAYLDYLCAYSSNGSTDDASCSETTPYVPYQTAILNAQNGVPSSTAARAGKTVTSGNAGMQ
jgi:hypothetical protein